MENVEVVVGTYENHLLGYKITTDNIDKNPVLETSFTDDSHRGALRCVAISPTGLLASSSTDDSIRLHSLRRRKEIGGLFEHNGTVNSMVFYDNNHMFSASEDGTICLWKTKNWEMMRSLKGHKSHVMAVAVHPSGKLGLSIGSDRSFVTWDLLTGKLAFQRKLQDVAQNIYFTPSGNHYVLVYNRKFEVCSLADTKIVKEVSTEWRINAVSHVEENIFAVGGDDRHVMIVDVLTGEQHMTLDAAKSADEQFNSRVRCICVIDLNDQKHLFLATASGNIKVFCLDVSKGKAKTLFYSETRVRVTAMGVHKNSKIMDRPDSFKDEKPQLPITKDFAADDESDKSSGSDEDSEDVHESNGVSKAKKRKSQQGITKSGKKKKKAQESSDTGVLRSKKKKVARDVPDQMNRKKLKAKRRNK